MADNAFNWASPRGLVRTNEVHGEEEAKLVLKNGFLITEEQGQREEGTSVMEVEALWR